MSEVFYLVVRSYTDRNGVKRTDPLSDLLETEFEAQNALEDSDFTDARIMKLTEVA